MEIIVSFILIAVAFVSGGAIGRMQVRQEFIDTLKAAEVKITLAKHGSQIYAHDEVTGSFLVQGTTLEEVISKLAKLDPTKTYIAKASVIKELTDADIIRVS